VKFVPLIGKGGWREGGGLEDRPRRRVRTQDQPEPIADRVKVLPAFRDAEREATDDRASEKGRELDAR
jgi:hypothetical protein